MAAKRLELVHQLVPKATEIGMVLNPVQTSAESRTRKVQEAALSFGLRVHVQSLAPKGKLTRPSPLW